MKTHQTPPSTFADIDLDGTVPADFPVPDDVLDLIDEAAPMSDLDGDEAMIEHFHSMYLERFMACRELAGRLCAVVRENGAAPASRQGRSKVLARYRTALVTTGWTSAEEAHWVTHRMALWLGWSDASAVTSHSLN